MTGIILTADIGTSSLKAAFIDLNGNLHAFTRIAYEPDSGGNTGAGVWKRAFANSLEDLFRQAPACVIDGICISGNGPTLVPTTIEGDTLTPLYWFDDKTTQAASSASGVTSSFFLPHAAWLKKNAFHFYEETKFFVSSHEWLALMLGAPPLTVLPSKAYEPYYWDDEQCRLFDVNREKFPPFITMGEIMGHVSNNASAFFSSFSGNRLKSGTPIIAGGPDFITAMIGTGTKNPGDVCDRAGSSEGINVCSAAPVSGKGFRLLPHAVEGLWNIGIVLNSSGRLFESYRNHTGLQDISYDKLLGDLIPSPRDTDIFEGDFFFPNSQFPISCSPIELGRAVLCAIGFSVRSALITLKDLGFPVNVMRLSGGQSKSERWNQLKADITGVSLMVPEISDGELAGNAVLAALALDGKPVCEKTAFENTVNRMIRFREIYEPVKNTSSFWENRYGLFRANEPHT